MQAAVAVTVLIAVGALVPAHVALPHLGALLHLGLFGRLMIALLVLGVAAGVVEGLARPALAGTVVDRADR
jgi:hypothetical protein